MDRVASVTMIWKDGCLRISATLELHHYVECGATQFSCLSQSTAVVIAVKYEKFMSHKSASSQPTNKEVILVTRGLTFHMCRLRLVKLTGNYDWEICRKDAVIRQKCQN